MTQPAQSSPDREHFIPLRADDLAHLLASSELIGVGEQHEFLDVCRILKSVFHFEYHEELLRLKNTYAPFDPDSDTVSLRWSDENSDELQSDALFESLVHMFERANFKRLNRSQLEKAFQAKSAWGLNLEVDFDIFERLELFARGETVVERDHRDWRNWYRLQKKEVTVHQRLVVAFKLRPGELDGAGREGVVTLKIFKEIPKGDLEMLLPGTRVRMTLLDRAKIALPTISGLAMTVYKIISKAMVIAFAGAYGILGFLGLVGGTIGYGVKSFFGYLRTKDKYQADLTRNLYYQNLDNNAGVLFRLLDEVEEQEFREAILAYALLTETNAPHGRSLDELDQEAEELLLAATDREIDFEAEDAISKLKRLGLVTETSGNYRAVPIRTALHRLSSMWDSLSIVGASPQGRAA